MFDLLDFIDSPDVREFNRGTIFTPLEMAVIVNMSRKRSLYEKIDAWEELLAAYPAEAFVLPYSPDTAPAKDAVERTVRYFHNALSYAEGGDGVVFVAEIWVLPYSPDEEPTRRLFSSYSKALDHLLAEKKEYVKLYGDPVTRAMITRRTVDSDGYCDCMLVFDNDMKLTEADAYDEKTTARGEKPELYNALESVPVRIPIPFGKGDLIKWIPDGGTVEFGILRGESGEEDGGMSSCARTVDVYIPKEESSVGYPTFDEMIFQGPTTFEKTEDSEIPTEKRNLLFLREEYRGRIHAGEIFRMINTYEDEAYDVYCI